MQFSSYHLPPFGDFINDHCAAKFFTSLEVETYLQTHTRYKNCKTGRKMSCHSNMPIMMTKQNPLWGLCRRSLSTRVLARARVLYLGRGGQNHTYYRQCEAVIIWNKLVYRTAQIAIGMLDANIHTIKVITWTCNWIKCAYLYAINRVHHAMFHDSSSGSS